MIKDYDANLKGYVLSAHARQEAQHMLR